MKKPTKSIITSTLLAVAFGALSVGSTFALFTSQSQTEIDVTAGRINLQAPISVVSAWELGGVPMSGSDFSYTNSIGGTITKDSSNVVHLNKLAPGDGAEFALTPNNSGTNINTKVRLVAKLEGSLAPALNVEVKVDDTIVIGFKGAHTGYTPWEALPVGSNPTAYHVVVSFPDGDNGNIAYGNDNNDNQYKNKSASLIVGYELIQGNAYTDGILEVINTKLMTEAYKGSANETMYDALKDLSDSQVAAVKSNGYVWGVDTDQFYDFANLPDQPHKYFMVYNEMPSVDDQTYSVYANNGFTVLNGEVNLKGIGFDAGDVENISSVSYIGASDARSNIIRTNSSNTSVTINAANDTVKHYGVAGGLNIIAVANSSYHEFGKVAFAEISKGRIALEEGAQVNALHISSIKENEQTTNEFDTIIVAIAKDVEKPTFSRDDVEIAATGTLVVALQEGTEEVTQDTSLDYVWLTKQGIFEQIKVSNNNESTDNAKWADDSSLKETNTQEAAVEIANNIGRNSDTQKVEEVVNNEYTVILDEETRELVITDANNDVVYNAEIISAVITTAVEEKGYSQAEKEEKKSEIVDNAIIEEIESKEFSVRVGTKPYDTLEEAINGAQNGDTITLLEDISETNSINKNITVDLNGFKVTAPSGKPAFTLYDLDSAVIKNGTINGQIKIGEHKYTIAKWKSSDHSAMYGYHPLAPAKSVELKDLKLNSGDKTNLYFTNIEDDLTRVNESNHADNDLYGHYIYKTGYQQEDQYTYKKRDEVFTVCECKDKVTVNNCEFISTVDHVGNMHDYADEHLYTEVLDVKSGKFSNDSLGRFIPANKYLVGENASKFTVEAEAPTSYVAKVNNIFYEYEGGANNAITYANFGETVYIKEAADVEKVFGENKHGVRDELTIVYEDENAVYTGATPYSPTYDIVDSAEGNSHLFYSDFAAVAAVYKTSKNGDWRSAEKLNEYGSLKDAFAALSLDYTVVILRDITVGDEDEVAYSNGTLLYDCAANFSTGATVDFNGHMITYTGKGACLVSSPSSKSFYMQDTSGTNNGGITATEDGAFCFRKINAGSDYLYIKGGKYISQKDAALGIDKTGNSLEISGGYFEGPSYWLSKGIGFNQTITITGGTFIPSQDATTSHIPSAKGCRSNGSSGGGSFNCLVEGTLVRMADGSLKDVANIVAGDSLMVFDHMTGEISASPVVFNDSEERATYTVLALQFANNQTIEIVDEHGFFDMNLMKYVYITEYNYEDFIGHEFYTLDGTTTLTAASLSEKECALYSPVTAGTLNLFAGDVLSMPGGVEGLFNIFEYDADLKFNEELMAQDIATYGLLDYSYFEALIPYEVYEAFNGRYLGIAMAKGILSEEALMRYIERYSIYWN